MLKPIPPESSPYNTEAWRRASRRHRAENPICEVCNIAPSTECHDPDEHHPPHPPRKARPLVAVCRRCHMIIHGKRPSST